MSLGNPDILILILNDLVEKLDRWKTKSSEVLRESRYIQRNSNDIVARAETKTRIISNQAHEDNIAVEQITSDTNVQYDKYEAYLETANKLEHRSQEIRNQALQTFSHWSAELRKAQEWLIRAQNELNAANLELEHAIYAVQTAESNLSQAKYALSDCESKVYKDKDGKVHYPNCSSQERAVSEAASALSEAQQRETRARARVQRAQEDLRRAQARVDCCRNAVALSEQACSEAKLGLDYSTTAVNYAERSIENTQSALQYCELARLRATEQLAKADQMNLATQTANQQNNRANQSLIKSDQLNTSAYNYAVRGKQDMDYRLSALREFAAPVDLPHMPATGGMESSNTFTLGQLFEELSYEQRLYRKIQKKFGPQGANLVADERSGGHSIQRHSSRIQDSQLRQRIMSSNGLYPQSLSALKFNSDEDHIESLHFMVNQYKNKIDEAFKAGKKYIVLDHTFNELIGAGYTNVGSRKKPSLKKVHTHSARLVLVRSKKSKLGFQFHTFYPLYKP
jgi:hypothetical protein